ncbi:MAG: apolipoprotein N-acyltransferase [Desulfobacterales bacterium]
MKKLLPWLFSVTAGVLAFLGYVGYNQFYLEWFFLVPLLWAARKAPPGRAFLLGWTAGTVGYAGGFYWFVHMLTTFAGLNLAFSLLGLFLFSAFNGLSFAIFTWAACRLRLTKGWSVWWTAPFIWTAIENVYPFLFPNYMGASQYLLLPLTQIADITGILGISFLLIWCNATVYTAMESLIERREIELRKIAIFLAAIGLTAAYGMVRIGQIDAAVNVAPKLKVVMIQTGEGEASKFNDPLSFIRLHQKMSQRAILGKPADDADLVIWPESVSVYPISRELKQLPQDLFGNTGKPLLFGTITAERLNGKIQKYASALLADGQNTVLGLYDKRILVPFGEYIPFGDIFPVLYKWLPYTSRLQPGKHPDSLPFGSYRLSLNICYEDLFYGLIRQNMTAGILDRKDPPHAIINLTNDSWYGDTIEPLEHLVSASFRSIEHRRALVRSTNTGISAIVDPVGRLEKRTGQWTQETLVGEVPMMSGRTIFSHAGNWFGLAVTAFVLVLLGISFKPTGKTEKKKHLRKAQRKTKNR